MNKKGNYTIKKNTSKILMYAIVIPIALLAVVPFAWLVMSSLKPESEIVTIPPSFFPSKINLIENYGYILFQVDQMASWILNTVMICVSNVLLVLVSSTFVAYGFARFRCKANMILFYLLLSTMMIPWAVTMVPSYALFNKIGWIGTYLPLIVPSIGGSPFYIFMMRQYIMGIPRELDEAAHIDGAGSFSILWRIIVPNSMPIMATIVIFTFVGCWGDFIGPNIYISDMDKFTLSLGLNSLRSGYGVIPWHYLMAASVLFSIPVIFIYFGGMKFFTKGLVMSGIK